MIDQVIVAASTGCFPETPLPEVIEILADLEFTAVEIVLDDNGIQMPPSRLVDDFDESLRLGETPNRLDICSYDVQDSNRGGGYYQRFEKICDLAKATKVVTLTIPSGEHGTPFNQEVEHLQRVVSMLRDGARGSCD